ncbi:hypothetical protein O181_016237 [Austropuccinia psidii MF-1]|uniref:Uncharacterized protein n=1 Tax=Austropuccinia psidii MF-1 TaxID=1389203 RepID=A0A9Q3C577_9BASI|nr:hypothetical protein [Austropuccinia psidii MF-1]
MFSVDYLRRYSPSPKLSHDVGSTIPNVELAKVQRTENHQDSPSQLVALYSSYSLVLDSTSLDARYSGSMLSHP